MIKVFKMNDVDWVAGEELEAAKEWYLKETDQDADEAFFDGEPEEIEDSQLDVLKLNFEDECPPRVCTFREELDRLIASGNTFPMIFASTEY
jgi:hypothetical protein